MGKKSSGSDSQTTTSIQQADPWVGVQPHLMGMYQNAATISGMPNTAYAGPSVAAPNPALQSAWGNVYGMGMNAPIGLNAAGAANQNFAEGAGIRGNPFISGAALGANNAYVNGTQMAANPFAQGNTWQQQFYDPWIRGEGVNSNQFASGGMYKQDATAQGGMLNADQNPYMRQMVDAASRPIVENFQKSIAPSLASQFSLAGRMGSGSHVAAFDSAAGTLGRQLSDTSGQLYGQAYQQERGLMEQAKAMQLGLMSQNFNNERTRQFDANAQRLGTQMNAFESERGRQYGATQFGISTQADQFARERQNQMQAIGNAPGLEQARYFGPQQAMQVGQQMYNIDQNQADAQKQAYEYNRDAPMNTMMKLNSIYSGAAPYASQSGSTSQQLPKTSPFAAIAGGGLMGGALGPMMGMTGGMGALLGAGLGLFGR